MQQMVVDGGTLNRNFPINIKTDDRKDDYNIMFTAADAAGCGYYRTLVPVKNLRDGVEKYPDIIPPYQSKKKLGIYWRVGFDFNDAALLYMDVIWVQRQFDPKFCQFVDWAHSKGKKVIYEIDDDFWHLHKDNRAKAYYPIKVQQMMADLIKKCDAVTCSTEPLRQILLRWNPNVFVIPNRIDVCPDERILNNEKVRIMWSGSDNHKGDFNDKIIKSLLAINNDYRGKVEMLFMGYVPPKLQTSVKFVPFVRPDTYVASLHNLNADIGLIFTAPIAFNESKSALKFYEYSLCSAASIASPSYPYINTMDHDRNGLIVDTDDDWYEYISCLVDNECYRKKLASNAYDYVSNNFTYKNNTPDMMKEYKQVLDLINS